MFKKRRVFLLVVISLVFSLGIVSSQTYRAKADEGIPNTPDAKEIMDVMDRAYQIMGYAAQSFDVSEFPSVFIDTDDYKLTDQQREAMAGILDLSAAEVKNTGYLTVMQTQYIAMGQGASLLKTALDKARAENRELTAEEFQEITKANHGQMPSLDNTITSTTVLTFESIEIDGDKAVVRYDDGAALQEAILVKAGEQWLIASIVPIWIHF